MKNDKKMVERISWDEFRETGLLLFVNSFLHIFGLSIVVEIQDGAVVNAYPARCRFRGFDTGTVEKAHGQLAEYIWLNAVEFTQDAIRECPSDGTDGAE